MLKARISLMLCAAFLLAACDTGSDPTPLDAELAQLRLAVGPLRTLGAAQAAGYTVEVTHPTTGSSYFPGMGVHYLNPDLLDDQFDLQRPEVLIFVPDGQGGHSFVAVEYVTPIADLDNPPPAPAGFTGETDTWTVNTDFSLWTLHAWVGLNNTHGVFASHNPAIP